jgi:hypothetical protein
VLGEQAEALFAQVQRGQRGVPGAARLGFVQLTLDGGQQPGEAVFEDEVVRAAAHEPGGGLLADLTGHEDERDVEPVLGQQCQGPLGAEAGDGVVGYDDVRGAQAQRLRHRRGAVHPLEVGSEPATGEVRRDQDRVVLVVLTDQDPDWSVHSVLLAGGGGTLTRSQ